MKPKPRIVWLAKRDCGDRAIDPKNELAIESRGETLVAFKVDKRLEYNIVGIFKSVNWEGCDEGYGGFFFGKKKG